MQLTRTYYFFILLAITSNLMPYFARAQEITCTARKCTGNDGMGNEILLKVNSDRLDSTKSYTARIGDREINVKRRPSPIVSSGIAGQVLMVRPETSIKGKLKENIIDLVTDGSGRTTGTIGPAKINCAVNGFSVFDPSPCF